MERKLIFEFDIPENNKNIWFNVRDNTLCCKNERLFNINDMSFNIFRCILWEWLGHYHYSDTREMNKDIRKYPNHSIIYDWVIYMFCKEEGYMGTCRIKIEKDKIICLTLNTEANVTDDLELIIKKLKGFTKLE